MPVDYQIPEPFLFNPLKHHLGFIKDFINNKIDNAGADIPALTKELKHLGRSVMDVYSGSLSTLNICNEVKNILDEKNRMKIQPFSLWTGTKPDDFRTISLSDGSQWVLKFKNNKLRYIHLFPARNSQHTFRVKSNTLKSALLYLILIGKDYITVEEMNNVRPLIGLSPIKNIVDIESILEMAEILRD